MVFDFLPDKNKVVIGMVHIGALPGAPLYDRDGGIEKLIDGVLSDLEGLQEGGIDAIMFGNENDRPYVLKGTPETISAMSSIVATVKSQIRVPFGVNYLWDPAASIAIAGATGASFVREIFTGVYASDMGIWEPKCREAFSLKDQLGLDDLKLLFNINAEFAHSLDQRSLALRAKSAVFSSLADAILVSGPMTGQGVVVTHLHEVRDAIGDTPLFANTGVNVDNVDSVLGVADGCIVGTHFKVDGNTWKAIDRDRVTRFMEKVEKLR